MLVQLLKHMFNARLTYVILFLSVFLIGLPAEALQAQHRKTSDLPFKELMQQAQQKQQGGKHRQHNEVTGVGGVHGTVQSGDPPDQMYGFSDQTASGKRPHGDASFPSGGWDTPDRTSLPHSPRLLSPKKHPARCPRAAGGGIQNGYSAAIR